jgi:hypothetical protein
MARRGPTLWQIGNASLPIGLNADSVVAYDQANSVAFDLDLDFDWFARAISCSIRQKARHDLPDTQRIPSTNRLV